MAENWGPLDPLRKLPRGTVITGKLNPDDPQICVHYPPGIECRHAWRLAQMALPGEPLARRCRKCGRIEALRDGQWTEVKPGDS